LNFLDASHKYHLTYFKDGINADQQAMDYREGEEDVDNSTHIRMNLVRNGGWCGVIQ
jgi:alpha-glucosidase